MSRRYARPILSSLPKVQNLSIYYQPHPRQLECHKDPARFRVLSCGRRWGKTLWLPYEMYGIMKDYVPILKERQAKGKLQQIPRAWIVAPTYPLVEEDWKSALQLFNEIIVEKNIAEKWMTLHLGNTGSIGLLEFKSAERGDAGLRGAGLVAAGFDEASRIPKDAWEYGIRPALAVDRGRACFVSTPAGRNWFYDVWRQGQDPTQDQWKSWQLPTITNPFFSHEEWEYLKKTTPEMIWKQEYLAEFLEDNSGVFHGLDKLEPAFPRGRQEKERYVLGVDLAKSVDWTVIIVMTIYGEVVHILRTKELSWSMQKKLIYNTWERYKPAQLWVDSSGVGDPIENDLFRMGITTQGLKTNSAIVKSELIENLSIAVSQGLIKLPYERDFPEYRVLWDELKDYGYKVLDTGHIRYQAPEGKHDDCVMALSLAAWGARASLGRKPAEKPTDTGYTTWKELWDVENPRNANKIQYRYGRSMRPALRFRIV